MGFDPPSPLGYLRSRRASLSAPRDERHMNKGTNRSRGSRQSSTSFHSSASFHSSPSSTQRQINSDTGRQRYYGRRNSSYIPGEMPKLPFSHHNGLERRSSSSGIDRAPSRRPTEPPGCRPSNVNLIIVDEKDKQSYDYLSARVNSVDSRAEKRRDNCSLNFTVSPIHVAQVPVASRSSASPKYPKPSMPTPPPPPRKQLLKYSPLPPRNGPSIKSLANAKLDLPLVSPATTEKDTIRKKTGHKFQRSRLYPPPPRRKSSSGGHGHSAIGNSVFVDNLLSDIRKSSPQESLLETKGHMSQAHTRRRSQDEVVNKSSNILSDVSRSNPQDKLQESLLETKRHISNVLSDMRKGDPREKLQESLLETKRRISQAADTLDEVVNKTQDKVQESLLESKIHMNQDQEAKPSPSDAQHSKVAEEHKQPQHKGFRLDYQLGETARSSSHMIRERHAEKATESIDSLANHDFAFVKRSDGSYSYAILAHRFNEETALEDGMTFVLSKTGCTKTIKKSQWSNFVRLPSPSSTSNNDCKETNTVQPKKSTGILESDDKNEDSEPEVQSDHDVEEYIKKLRQEFYSTRPASVGDGWLPPTMVSVSTLDDDLISCFSAIDFPK